MGIDPDNGWVADWQIIPEKEKVLKELKKAAKSSDHIYLATDLDREGEAIAWHLKEALDLDNSKIKRIVFREITKKAIQNTIVHKVIFHSPFPKTNQSPIKRALKV